MSALSSIPKLYHRIFNHIDERHDTLQKAFKRKRGNKTISPTSERKILHILSRTLGTLRVPDEHSIGATRTQIRKCHDVVYVMNAELSATRSLSSLLASMEKDTNEVHARHIRLSTVLRTATLTSQPVAYPVTTDRPETVFHAWRPGYSSSVSSDSWSEYWESESAESFSDDEVPMPQYTNVSPPET